ncbi:hypothetical protein [Lignipirellula cremea]|uniref:Uncharacterized protein n=1 Tax=Lignipirellula cremea TaxID=2528010 RepID=A0A518E015_9BACT|nr:hypothetical protein [Lignipirellula cremea]QDU97427.1 hypothetical protein Pla8534_52750 [Lignipirellula cremea]
MPRQSWLDDSAQTPVIDDYAQKLTSYVDAMADGKIEEHELESQEQRLVALMKEVEPLLDDAQHAKVTELLCEMTAYNLMRIVQMASEHRGTTVWRP